MSKSLRNDQTKRIFISFSADDSNALDHVVHFQALSETSALDTIRRRRLREIRWALLKDGRGTSDGTGLIGYFDPSQGRVVLTTNYDRIIDWHSHLSAPVSLAGILSIFLSGEKRDSFIGDVEERFRFMVNKKGRRAATIWFWREVLHSFLSLALDALKRVSGFEKLMERYR